MAGKVEKSLYRTEEQIAEDVLGPGNLARWRSLAIILERQGMPQIDPLMGGRYGPAIRAFFDRRAGLSERTVPSRADQPEKFRTDQPEKSDEKRRFSDGRWFESNRSGANGFVGREQGSPVERR